VKEEENLDAGSAGSAEQKAVEVMMEVSRKGASYGVRMKIPASKLVQLVLASWLAIAGGACGTISGERRPEGPIVADCQPASLPVERLEASERIRLIITGDTGADAENLELRSMAQLSEAIDDEMRRGRIDGIVILGDLFYPCGLTAPALWEIYRPLARLGLPIFPLHGNHDYGLQRGCPVVDPCLVVGGTPPEWLAPWWRFPAPNYQLDAGGLATLAMIDSNPLSEGWVESDSVERRLEAVLAPARTPWRIVALHHTFRSSGPLGSRREAMREMRGLIPSLQRLAAAVVLSGHDHHLELVGREGEPLWVISGSGSKTRGARGRTAGSLIRESRRGYVILDLTAATLTVTFHRLDGTLIGDPAVLERQVSRSAVVGGAGPRSEMNSPDPQPETAAQ
jgi:tartrate-resistant acid phosphatase type 5